ncbi:MAG: HD domain-containing protein [Armatimonadota bacterium]|nr:HD domain-containing protein [Armatimonadota bacterium]
MTATKRLPADLQFFVMTVLTGAIMPAWFLMGDIRLKDAPQLMLFVFLIMITSMAPIPNPRGGYITATTILMYVLMAVQKPGAALLAASAGHVIGRAVSGEWVPWKSLSNGAQRGVSVMLGGLAFVAAGGSFTTPSISGLFLPLLIGSLVHHAANNLFVALYFSRLRRSGFFSVWVREIRDFLGPNLLSIPTAALLVVLYAVVHPLTLVSYLVLLPAQRWAIKLYLQYRDIHRQAIDALVMSIDAHFPRGAGHSRRVADIAAAIARRMRLSDAEVEAVELGALLHDVGMIGVDVGEAGVRDPEYAVRRHVVLGADVAGELRRKDVQEIVLHHHERFDGTGYPRGLGGDRIPLGARIVAVAEAYDTLVSGGSHHQDPMPPAAAVREIQTGSGTAFDPAVVRAFMSLVDESGRVVTDRVADSG